jgi:Uma2 family endonuclease
MAAVLEKQGKRWTYEEYCRLNDDQRHEIIGGNLLVAPAPDTWHQDWARNLFRLVDEHVRKGVLGQVYFGRPEWRWVE